MSWSKYRVYYSGSMQGAVEPRLDLGCQIVSHMKTNGAKVLSEHVPIADHAERDALFLKNSGIDTKQENANRLVHDQDMLWVEIATHLVVLANAKGSYGVGMEIEHAVLKPRLGLNMTPVLILRKEDTMDTLSWMVTGKLTNGYWVKGYLDDDHAIQLVTSFLDYFSL